MRPGEIAELLQEERLKRACPWTPVSAEQLTAREFLSLIGIKGKGRRYRRTLRHLSLTCTRNDEADRAPGYLTKCFRQGVIVQVFQGRGHGAVSVEYRIPVESLEDEYADRARRLISGRSGKPSDSISVSRETYKHLVALSGRAGKSIPDMVEEWARREWRFWLESGNVLSTGEANQQDA
jgi:hypothetical protein